MVLSEGFLLVPPAVTGRSYTLPGLPRMTSSRALKGMMPPGAPGASPSYSRRGGRPAMVLLRLPLCEGARCRGAVSADRVLIVRTLCGRVSCVMGSARRLRPGHAGSLSPQKRCYGSSALGPLHSQIASVLQAASKFYIIRLHGVHNTHFTPPPPPPGARRPFRRAPRRAPRRARVPPPPAARRRRLTTRPCAARRSPF